MARVAVYEDVCVAAQAPIVRVGGLVGKSEDLGTAGDASLVGLVDCDAPTTVVAAPASR